MSKLQTDEYWLGRFESLVGVVTGGEIGQATARQLLQEGARVYFSDIDKEKANAAVESLRAEGLNDVTGTQLDVTNERQVEERFDRVVEETGQLHFASSVLIRRA